MSEYHKIQTIFKRDMSNGKKLMPNEWTRPEFEYLSLNEWEFTEKVDGTNIRIIVGEGKIEFGGRTANASIPAPLVARLNERFLPQTDILLAKFLDGAVLYGEGYGAKIQKVGGNYRQDQDFVLFDVKVGDWWLRRTDVEEVAIDLGLDVVPVVGRGDLFAAMSMVRSGMRSTWGDFEAEGIVARPTVDLKMQNGSRIITKIKCRDFA